MSRADDVNFLPGWLPPHSHFNVSMTGAHWCSATKHRCWEKYVKLTSKFLHEIYIIRLCVFHARFLTLTLHRFYVITAATLFETDWHFCCRVIANLLFCSLKWRTFPGRTDGIQGCHRPCQHLMAVERLQLLEWINYHCTQARTLYPCNAHRCLAHAKFGFGDLELGKFIGQMTSSRSD